MEIPETKSRAERVRAAHCSSRPGAFAPIINRNKCEGKSECVEVCPYGVFEIRRIEDADYSRLSWVGKLKSMAHGKATAYTPHADQCQACGLCVAACPERAIRLVKQTTE